MSDSRRVRDIWVYGVVDEDNNTTIWFGTLGAAHKASRNVKHGRLVVGIFSPPRNKSELLDFLQEGLSLKFVWGILNLSGWNTPADSKHRVYHLGDSRRTLKQVISRHSRALVDQFDNLYYN